MPVKSDKNRFVFTWVRLDRLPRAAPAERDVYFDADCPGLSLRVTDQGVKSFIVRGRVRGRGRKAPERRVTLGEFPEMSVDTARTEALRELASLRAGIDPKAKRDTMRAELTLGELFRDFMVKHAKPRKRTWANDERLFNGYIKAWADRCLTDIRSSEVRNWHARVGQDHGPVIANRAQALLRKLFNFARGEGFKGENPAQGITRFREISRDRFLNSDELRWFFTALRSYPEATARDYFALALFTGARRANVLGMRWEDLDLERGQWRIPGEQSKSGEPLVVILAPPVVSLLRSRRRRVPVVCSWVLPSAASATGHYTEPKKAWRSLLAQAEQEQLLELIAKSDPARSIEDLRSEAAGEQATEAGRSRRRELKGAPSARVLASFRKQAEQLGLDQSRLGMRNIRIHDLRRTLGSWQAAHGASLSVIGRSLGHKQVQTTAIYARLNIDAVRESVEKAASAMVAIAGLPTPTDGEEA